MATSYSTNLALALPVQGELSGTWGDTVNDNITKMLDEGLGYQAFSATGGSDTLTIPNGTTGVARSIYIQLNGTGGGTVNVPTTKTKMYFVFNNTASAITFKVTGQTGVSIPAAGKMALVSNGTDIIVAQNYFSALTLGAALPVASGGTGLTAGTSGGILAYTASGTLASSALLTQYGVVYGGGAGAVPVATANGTTGQAFIATTSGAPSWGTLPVAGGGTGLTAGTSGGIPYYSSTSAITSSALLTQYGVVYGGGAGAAPVATANGTTGQAFIATTSGAPSWGTLPIAGGGTNSTATATAGGVGYGTGTAHAYTAASTGGYILTSGGAGAPAFIQTLPVANGGTGQTTYTDGQLLIGNTTGNTLTKTTLTAGSNITITNGSGAITIAASGGGASAATPTALGTVYGATSSGSPYLTALGYAAGGSNTGVSNTAIGYQAGTNTTSGTYNVSVGQGALQTNVSGSNNIAIGRNAVSASTGSDNTGVGYNALSATSTGASNVAIGSYALTANTTATNNVAVGYQALYTNTTGYESTSLGYQSLYTCTTGFTNVAIGAATLRSLTTGNDNVAIGNNAGNSNYGSGAATTTGVNNVFVGAQALAAAAGNSSCVVIGSSAVGKGASTAFISGGGGATYNGGNTTTFTTTSDRRLKKNIVDNTVGLSAINSIRVRNFEYRLPEEVDAELKPTDAIKKSGVQLGVIAQELQAVLPDCVKQETTGVFSVDSDNLTWYMVNAIKELKAEFDAYKTSHP